MANRRRTKYCLRDILVLRRRFTTFRSLATLSVLKFVPLHIRRDKIDPTTPSRPSGNLADDAAQTIVYQSMPLAEVCSDLYRRGVTSLMVEGGAETINAFVEARLWDEARVERSPMLLHDGVAAPALPEGELSCCFVDTNRIIQVKKK